MGPKKETKVEPKETTPNVPLVTSISPTTDTELGSRYDLIDAIQRYSNLQTTPKIYPKKLWSRHYDNKLKIIERDTLECTIIRSCLLVASNNSLSVSKLFSMIQSMNFSSEALEMCRMHVTLHEIKLAARRMEERNEVDVFYSAKGELVVQSAHSINYHLPPESKFGSQIRRPPKLQSKHDFAEAAKTKVKRLLQA